MKPTFTCYRGAALIMATTWRIALERNSLAQLHQAVLPGLPGLTTIQ